MTEEASIPAALVAPQFRLFVIFHKAILPACYVDCSDEDLERYVRFYAVNETIPKEIPERFARWVIHEKDLPVYDPSLQVNRFCESSAFAHVYMNQDTLIKDIPYVGFFHYDMRFTADLFRSLEHNIAYATERGDSPLFPLMCHEGRPHITQVFSLNVWDEFLSCYRTLNGSPRTIFDIVDAPLPFYHTYVMQRAQLSRLVGYMTCIIPAMFQLLGTHLEPVPMLLERFHALMLGLERMDGIVPIWIPLSGVTHDPELRDAWRDGRGGASEQHLNKPKDGEEDG